MKVKKRRSKQRKKRFKKQERLAKIAIRKRIPIKKSRKKRKFKINWQKIHSMIIIFRKSNLFMNFQELHGLSLKWTSAGRFGFKRRQRNKFQSVIFQMVKFSQYISFNGDTYPLLVWNGIPRRNHRTIIKGLKYGKRKFKRISWRGSLAKIYIPFNGCRRRKQKRK